MYLPRLLLEKQSAKDRPAFYSDEVRRTLSMGIPVAVVIKMPSLGGGVYQLSHTNILLYFPHMYKVIIYEYTQLKGKFSYKFIAEYGDGDDLLGELPSKYTYSVELTPFLLAYSNSRNNGDTIFSFFIQCADVSSKIVEVKLLYKDEDRQDEWIDLFWFTDDTHRSEGELIARWVPELHQDKDNNYNSYLIWKTGKGTLLKDKESVPTIRGYHEEEEKDY